MYADSLLISADNGHVLHPNHPEKSDSGNRPVLNGGIVLKYHGNQQYTTDAYTGAMVKDNCKKAELVYENKSYSIYIYKAYRKIYSVKERRTFITICSMICLRGDIV